MTEKCIVIDNVTVSCDDKTCVAKSVIENEAKMNFQKIKAESLVGIRTASSAVEWMGEFIQHLTERAPIAVCESGDYFTAKNISVNKLNGEKAHAEKYLRFGELKDTGKNILRNTEHEPIRTTPSKRGSWRGNIAKCAAVKNLKFTTRTIPSHYMFAGCAGSTI
jgi:hypothetical protein